MNNLNQDKNRNSFDNVPRKRRSKSGAYANQERCYIQMTNRTNVSRDVSGNDFDLASKENAVSANPRSYQNLTTAFLSSGGTSKHTKVKDLNMHPLVATVQNYKYKQRMIKNVKARRTSSFGSKHTRFVGQKILAEHGTLTSIWPLNSPFSSQ